MIARKTRPRPISEKRLKALGGKVYSTITGPRTPIKKKARPADETKRIFGPKARMAWLKGLPCAACGYTGPILRDAAHAITGGMSRRSEFTSLLPLCAVRWEGGVLIEGCHRECHQHGVKTFESKYGISLQSLASDVARQWEERQQEKGT